MYTRISSPFMAGSASAQANGSPLVGSMQFSGGLHDFLRNLPGFFQGPSAHSVANEVVPGSAKKDDSNLLEDIWNYLNSSVDGMFSDMADVVKDFETDVRDMSSSSKIASASTAGNGSSGVPTSVYDYVNAELASLYGMDRSTAYQEALSNTAYQRAIKDMKAAGLNPAVLFGSGRGSGAGGVSYVSRSGSGSDSDSDQIFDEGLYYGLSALAGIIGAILTKSPSGYFIADSAAKGLMGATNSIFK